MNRALEASEQAEAEYRERQEERRRRESLRLYGHTGAHVPAYAIDSAVMRRLGREAYEAALKPPEGGPLSDIRRAGTAAAIKAYGTRRSGEPSEHLHQIKANRKQCFIAGYLAALAESNPCEAGEAKRAQALPDHPVFASAAGVPVDDLTQSGAQSAADLLALRAWFDDRKARLTSALGEPREASEPDAKAVLELVGNFLAAGDFSPERVRKLRRHVDKALARLDREPGEAERLRLAGEAFTAEEGYRDGWAAAWEQIEAALAEAKRALDE